MEAFLKIHEYQAKEILKSYGVPIQDGYVIEKFEDADATIDKVAKEFNVSQFVVKAQIQLQNANANALQQNEMQNK